MDAKNHKSTNQPPDTRERYRIEFAVCPGHLETKARLKALLKYAGRNLGLRCTRIRKTPPTEGNER